jgi:hypothetical protein
VCPADIGHAQRPLLARSGNLNYMKRMLFRRLSLGFRRFSASAFALSSFALGGFALSSCSSEDAAVEDTSNRNSSDDGGAEPDESAESDEATATSVTNLEGADGGTVQIVFSGEGVACGTERCRNATLSDAFSAMGCCANEDDSVCGLDLGGLGTLLGLINAGCEPLNLPGSEDASCEESAPLVSAIDAVRGVVLPGCCQATGNCGYSVSLQGIGFGCVSPTRFGFDEGGACDYQP